MFRATLFITLALSVCCLGAKLRPNQSPAPKYPSVPNYSGLNQPCYTNPSSGKPGGWCEEANHCCEGSLVISNLCPSYPANYKCCYSDNICNSATGGCSSSAVDYACKILELYEAKKINLKPNHFNSQGNNPYDGASALSNIRDTCYGLKAKRSSYGVAPGGNICLTSKMLKSMYDYAVNFYSSHGVGIDVNAIAGSEHSSNSYHYQGNTWDISCTTPINHCSDLTNWCLNQSPVEACYPGGPCAGHDTWVHCAH